MMKYRYYLVWYNISQQRRPLLRVSGIDIDIYRGNGNWEPDETYAGMFWGDVIVDEITEQEAMKIMKLKDESSGGETSM